MLRTLRYLRRDTRGTQPRRRLIRKAFARRVGLADGRWLATRRPRTARQAHLLELSSPFLAAAVLPIRDRTNALFGVESRFPFLDRRLVEFCLALPGEQKLQHGWTRAIARKALAGTLPEQVRWRSTKARHDANFVQGLIKFDREALDGAIQTAYDSLGEYIEGSILRELYSRWLRWPNAVDGLTIWLVALAGLWVRRSGFGQSALS